MLLFVYNVRELKYYIFIERNILKMVNTMNIVDIVKTLRENVTRNNNDSRQIIKHKNNIEYGNEIGIVLSNIDNSTFEVFIHAKINNEVISQLLYSTFNNIDEATKHYNKLEKYIIDFDLEGIVKEINN